jgi:hypothetical protein
LDEKMKKLLFLACALLATCLPVVAQPPELTPAYQEVNRGSSALLTTQAPAHIGSSSYRLVASFTDGSTWLVGGIWVPFKADELTNLRIPKDQRLKGLMVYVVGMMITPQRVWLSNRALVKIK